MKRKLIIFVILLFVLTSVGSFAAGTLVQITANLNQGLILKVDGEVKPILDSSGKPTSPIVYNNTTYLPLRFVAGLFNTPLAVDGNTVCLGKLAPENAKEINPTSSDYFYYSKVDLTGKNYEGSDVTFNTIAVFESVDGSEHRYKIDTQNAREFSFSISGGSKYDNDFVIQMFDNNGVLIDDFTWALSDAGKYTERKTYDVTGTKYIFFKSIPIHILSPKDD